MPRTRPDAARVGVAFLLTQLGTDAAAQYARTLADHDLTPPLAGIMRLLWLDPGQSQQQLAERLDTAPSRIVALVDDLETRGWLNRTRDTVDRRVNVLSLTDAGRDAFTQLAALSQQHERIITAPLTAAERSSLTAILAKLAAARDLTPGVHPGYRSL